MIKQSKQGEINQIIKITDEIKGVKIEMTAKIEELRELLLPYAECGDEKEFAQMLAEKLAKYTDDENITVDRMNNVTALIGDKMKKTILLEAHYDEISAIVSDISEEGFLRIAKVGGIDRRCLLSSEISVNDLDGIFCSVPPHLLKKEDAGKVPEFKDLYIDMGLNVEDVRKKVKIGDRIYFKTSVTELLNGRVSGRALDNKISVYAILVALKKLKKHIKNKELGCSIAVLFSTQEELGSRGARTGSYQLEPDEALVLDVTFAKQPDVTSQIMGEGIVIERSTHFDRNLVRSLVSIAKKKEIKYQTNAEAISGGTDASAIHVSGSGVPTVLLSIPIRYMHTPIETGDINDVESAADLMAEYIKTYKISEDRG